jgi:hypothetical protein
VHLLGLSAKYKLWISEDNIKPDFKETEWQAVDWIVLAQGRKNCRAPWNKISGFMK